MCNAALDGLSRHAIPSGLEELAEWRGIGVPQLGLARWNWTWIGIVILQLELDGVAWSIPPRQCNWNGVA